MITNYSTVSLQCFFYKTHSSPLPPLIIEIIDIHIETICLTNITFRYIFAS